MDVYWEVVRMRDIATQDKQLYLTLWRRLTERKPSNQRTNQPTNQPASQPSRQTEGTVCYDEQWDREWVTVEVRECDCLQTHRFCQLAHSLFLFLSLPAPYACVYVCVCIWHGVMLCCYELFPAIFNESPSQSAEQRNVYTHTHTFGHCDWVLSPLFSLMSCRFVSYRRYRSLSFCSCSILHK